MKNLEPISKIYFLLFAGVTGLIILMLFCGCKPANGITVKTEIDRGQYGGVFVFDSKSDEPTNEFDVFKPVNINGRWIRLDRACDEKAYLSPFDGYPEQWRDDRLRASRNGASASAAFKHGLSAVYQDTALNKANRSCVNIESWSEYEQIEAVTFKRVKVRIPGVTFWAWKPQDSNGPCYPPIDPPSESLWLPSIRKPVFKM